MNACCDSPRPLTYRTIRGPVWTTRYKRCANCGTCSKTVQRGFIDGRNWLERGDSLPDGADSEQVNAIMTGVESVSHRQE